MSATPARIDDAAVLGSGVMGHGIALAFALDGHRVSLYDVNEDLLAESEGRIRSVLDTLVSAGEVDEFRLSGGAFGLYRKRRNAEQSESDQEQPDFQSDECAGDRHRQHTEHDDDAARRTENPQHEVHDTEPSFSRHASGGRSRGQRPRTGRRAGDSNSTARSRPPSTSPAARGRRRC